MSATPDAGRADPPDGPPAQVEGAAALVARVVERAALDGSTVVPAAVVAAALRTVGVADPAPATDRAVASGTVAAYPDEQLFGNPSWADAEERVAEDLVRLVAAGGDGAVRVVQTPRGTDPAAVVGPLAEAVEAAGGTVRTVRAGTELSVDAAGGAQAPPGLLVVERADLLALDPAQRLLASLPDGAAVVLVGDAAMPPFAAPGQVLVDLVDCGALPVVEAPSAEPDGVTDALVALVRALRSGVLPTPDPTRREVVVTPADGADQGVRRAVQLVTDSVPRVFGLPVGDTLVVTPRADGAAGADALRAALASAGAPDAEVRTATEAVGREAAAVVLVLPGESAGSLARDLLVGAATLARLHLSVVHEAGPAVADAVARVPHRPRRTRLARLLTDSLG